ncbi:Pex19 protein family-domain-containing protein [Limtongia smithiae]|uniref:Pex19 protein family-domain-containing protein n=1 Tax=Limtongia smithiae TaxID=1125753 RepID=UPI0034CD8E34
MSAKEGGNARDAAARRENAGTIVSAEARSSSIVRSHRCLDGLLRELIAGCIVYVEIMPPPPPPMTNERVDDSDDDDDLNDLDDLLDEFTISTTVAASQQDGTKSDPVVTIDSTPSTTAAPPISLPLAPTALVVDVEDTIDTPPAASVQAPKSTSASAAAALTAAMSEEDAEEAFARQLELGIGKLLSELGEDAESKAQFEALMQGINQFTGAQEDAVAAEEHRRRGKEEAAAASGRKKENGSLQDTIAKTMERMKESGARVDREVSRATEVPATTAASGGEEDEFLAAMMRQLEQAAGAAGGADGVNVAGLGAEDDGDDEDLSRMLAGMMEQLTSKEILYEPMKELDDKYSTWLSTHQSSIPAADRARYERQRVVVREIVVRFERASYDDESEADRKYIVERMQIMQEAGAPPEDIMGELGPGGGLDFGLADGVCPTQ